MGPEKPPFCVTSLFSFPKCQCSIILVTLGSSGKRGRDWHGITDTQRSQLNISGYTSASTELTLLVLFYLVYNIQIPCLCPLKSISLINGNQ